jgi:predicted amidohydrolase
MTFGGYARLAAGPAAPAEAEEQLSGFRALSAGVAATVVGGSIRLPAGRRAATNSSVVFTRGRRIHRYDKIHLFRPCKDHLYFHPGREAKTFVFRTAGGEKVRAGVVICFDLRFPELVRLLALQGMQVLLVPARWPRKRDDAWRTLLKARAIENQIFVAGCNALGEEGGPSYVFDPSGEELLSTQEDPEGPVHAAVLDLGRIAGARMLHRNIEEAVVLRRLAKQQLTRRSRR